MYEELAVNFPLKKDPPPGFPIVRETYEQMFNATAQECANGVWLYQPMWAVLAKKS